MAETFRQHVPPHLRNIGEQQLDALLRIEELLVRLNEQFGEPNVTIDMAPSELIKNVTPTKTAFSEKAADKPKGGRGGPRRL